MSTSTAPQNYFRAFAVFLFIIFTGSSCTTLHTVSNGNPAIQTVPVTQLATILVTHEVTQEVTRVVEVPVTVTSVSTLTPLPDSTIASSPAPTPESPTVNILEHSDCMYGPGSGYLYKYSVKTDNLMEAIGRNLDGSWIYIQNAGGWNPCWIQATLVKLTSGDVNGLPVVYSRLPYSNQYLPPDATALRNGNEVTISWKAVWMSLDDYRGYLIEAWICQGGTQIFDPISFTPALSSNTGSLSIQVTDEPGCTSPSSARIYSAVKQGYSNWSSIYWPGN